MRRFNYISFESSELLHFMGGMNVVRGRKIFFLENDPLVVKFYGELEKNIFEA